MQLFFAPDLSGDHHTLDEQESKHCIRVLRMKAGDRDMLTDGRGNMYIAALANEDPRRCEVRVIEKMVDYGKRDYHIHIAIAPTKNISRFEWFLEKATEIGIDEITPLVCRHSERRVMKTDRLDKVLTTAMKQSVRAYHPLLHEAVSFEKFIKAGQKGRKYIAFIGDGSNPHLASAYDEGQGAVILIGPEGDFSTEEVEMAVEAGYQAVSLGNSRLRTETAGIVAVHTVALLNREDGKGKK